jgi:hypothetical protein
MNEMFRDAASTHEWIEDLLANDSGCGVVGLRQRSALADLGDDVIRHPVDVVVDQALAFLTELDGQLQSKQFFKKLIQNSVQVPPGGLEFNQILIQLKETAKRPWSTLEVLDS